MEKKFKFVKVLSLVVIIIGLLVIVQKDAKAEIMLSDCLSVEGFLRYEFGIHTGESNPNLVENHDLTLSRFFLQTEWKYKPSDQFSLFANIRFLGDTTSLWDSQLKNYDAFPVDVDKYKGLMMRPGDNDHFRAEVWELYGDISLGNLWLRLGRQQFAWGEMIGARILDAIYPLDLSWNMTNEPEEFELCRIPEWTIRGIYNLTDVLPGWVTSPTIEAFVIPGDVYPTFTADRNAPFFLVNLPSFFQINDKDRRGDVEYGARVGAGAYGFYATLNYMHIFSQDQVLKFKGFVPDPVHGIPVFAPGDFTLYSFGFDGKYPSRDLYGMSINYAFDQPLNLVVTYEGLWSPNEPWADAHPQNGVADIRDQGKFSHSISLTRNTWVWPKHLWSPSMMSATLQFVQYVVEGDENKIAGPSGNKIHTSMEWWIANLSQPLFHGTLTPGFMIIYDTRNAYYIKPSIKYAPTDHWYFDIFGTMFGGSEKNPYDTFGSSYWMDSVYGRITYQF